MDSIKLNGQCEHGVGGAVGCYQCSQNSLQQLKAEIAEIADQLYVIFYGNGCVSDLCAVANKLRQLSAV